MIVTHARLMTCDPARPGLGMVDDAAVQVRDGRVAWIGPSASAPGDDETLDAAGALVTPGLVDAHAHPIFGGERAGEFAMRAEGRSYLEIAAAGGGIASTVRATRAAADDVLVDGACARLARALAHGTTTMEAKTGYALELDGELRLLALLGEVAARCPVALSPTLLAHSVPAERAGDRAAFVAGWVRGLPAARGRAISVDVYCDQGAFTLDETRAILGAAHGAGLEVRAHAGQFVDLGAAGLVAELGGLSADHLEQVSEAQARAMAKAGVVATLLAGACVQLRLPPPPVARLRDAGCAFALGTDLNPGSSLSESLPVQMWLACTHLGLGVDEVWLGVTRVAARAAGRPEAGQLTLGAPGDMVIWATDDPRVVPYHYGVNLISQVIAAGRRVVG